MNARLTTLRRKIEPLLKPYARRISVFGSYARGEATSESDIDLLVSLRPVGKRPPFGLFEVIRMEQALENVVERPVDLVTEEGLNPRIKQNVDKDRVVLYEEK